MTAPTVNTSNEEAAQYAGIVLIALDVVTVAARFYARWFTKAGWKWDDWTILIALAAGILPGALSMWASSISPTGPAAASNLDPNYQFTEADILYTKITFSTSVLYFLCTCITKVSLLLLLYRLFAVSRNFRLWIYGALAIVVAFWFSATIADCLNCVPLEWTWRNGHADPRYCINFNDFWLGTGISESVIDLGILLLPVGMVWKLQLDRSKKWSVAGLFLLGGFVLFSGIAKVVLSYLPDSREPDFSAGALWTTVHLYTGIICANLPPCWPLFNKIARLSTGSWVRLSSLGKRWYGLSSGGSRQRSSKNSRATTATQTEDKSRNPYNNLSDVEVGRPDYELAMYGRDGQLPDDRTKLNASHVQVNRPQW